MGVTALIDAFVREKSEPEVGGTRGSWKPDEVLRTRQKLRCFPEFMGDLTMAELNLMPEAESTIREYITRLMTLPTGPNLSKARADDTAALAPQLAIWAQRNKVATMTFETAQGYVSKLAECFKWGIKKTYMQVNPAAGMGNDRRQARERPDLDRSLFSNFELGRIFGMPWFVEGRAAQTVSGKPGKQFRPYYYWIPLLALHCGGRANEIAQLYLADICVSAGNTPYIAFRLDRPDKLDIDERDGPDTLGEKSLKTVNSERDVPIHSSLIELGFLDYVEELRGAGHFRLFPELRFDRLKGYGLEASKWFNDRLLGRKLLIVRDGTKTLHSLRHHFATGIDPLGKHPRVQSQLLGHERGETLGQKRYTKDLSVEELRAYLDAIRFQLPDICRFDCKAALVAVKYALAVKRRNGTSA